MNAKNPVLGELWQTKDALARETGDKAGPPSPHRDEKKIATLEHASLLDDFADKDLHLFLGTTREWHGQGKWSIAESNR